MSNRNIKIKEKWKIVVPGLLTALTTCFVLFVYAPMELYMTNQAEFWFSLRHIARAVCENFLLFFTANAILMIISVLIHDNLCRLLNVLELILLLSSYIQGNFLVGNLPPFDGTEIRWDSYSVENVNTLIIWLVVALLFMAAYKFLGIKKMDFVNKLVSCGLGVMLFITLITLGLTSKVYEQRTTYYALEDGQYSLSQDQNFLILLLDAVDAKSFEEAMALKPEYKEVFTDFTYYPDMVGAYPWTNYSAPYILSGKWYEGEQKYLDYTAEAVDESVLFQELSEREYDIALYESDPWVTSYNYEFSNMIELQHEVYVWKYFNRSICKLGGIRYAPFFLKEYCYQAVTQVQGQHNAFVDESESLYTWDLSAFVEHMEEEEVSYQEGKCFKYYHLQGGHVPFIYDADLNTVEGNSSYSEMLQANISVVDRFLEKLKEAGVYDNSVIIIMSDHGFDAENEPSAYGRQNPIFFVKGIGESHPLQTSLIPASYEDLQEAYIQLLEGAGGDDIFPYEAGQQRERRYLFYENTTHTMYEWMQTGAAWDFDAYKETGTTYQRIN